MGIKGMKWRVRGNKSYEEPLTIEANFDEEKTVEQLNDHFKVLEENRKRALAIDMLLQANGNEEAMNDACDLIKQMGLVEGYR